MKTRTRRLFEHPLFPVVLWAIHLGLIGVAVAVIDLLPKDEIQVLLRDGIPWVLRVHFVLLALVLAACRRDIARAFQGLSRSQTIGLAILLLSAVLFTAFAAPRTHRIFFDEDIYANIGQTMALSGQAGFCNYGTFEYGEYKAHWVSYNKQPAGWPFLISLAFQLLGTNELYAFLLNNLLFAGSALMVFFIGRTVTGSGFASGMAALIYALIPHNLQWFNTASAEPAAAFFAGAFVLCLLVYLRTRAARHLLLCAALLPLACQMRPESILLIPWMAGALLLLAPRTLADRSFWIAALLSALLLLPHGLHLFATSGHAWGSDGTKFSLDFLRHNLNTNGLYYLDNAAFPVLFTLLAGAGLCFGRGPGKMRGAVLVWLLLFWGVFLLFYAGSYGYGADVRFALVSFMPLAVLAGAGAEAVRRGVRRWGPSPTSPASTPRDGPSLGMAILILLAAIQFFPLVRTVGQEAWNSRSSHQHAKRFLEHMPERSIVLTQVPSMFLVWGQGAIQTYAGHNRPELIADLIERYDGEVYFYEGYWCNTGTERNRRLCRAIRDRYGLEAVASAQEQHAVYTLYRIKMGPGP